MARKTKIVYTVVAHGKKVLAEHTSSTGNFPSVSRMVLSKLDMNQPRHTYKYDDSFLFYCLIDTETKLTFLTLGDDSISQARAFAFLENIQNLYTEKYEKDDRLFTEHSDDFQPDLEQQMTLFNDPIQPVQDLIAQVTNTAVVSIEKILEAGEKMHLLVEKTDQLQDQSKEFETSSKTLRRTLRRRQIKTMVCLSMTVLIILYGLLGSVCGFGLQCLS